MVDKKEKMNKNKRALFKLKKVLKENKATVTIKEYDAPSVLNDPNRFFKNELEETKRSLFFK
jgi:hypothetical protein